MTVSFPDPETNHTNNIETTGVQKVIVHIL